MKIANAIILLLFTELLFYTDCLAAEPGEAFIINPSVKDTFLGSYMDILEDPEKQYGIDDIIRPDISAKFNRSKQDEPSFGFTDSAYWVRLYIENPSNENHEWLLEVTYPLIDSVTLYAPSADNQYTELTQGDHKPFAERALQYRNILFLMSENPTAKNTYYLRFETSSSMILAMKYWEPDNFLESALEQDIVFGVFYGAILIMLIFNF